MRRRICVFCETWESGGIESFLHNVLLHMDLAGLDIDVVVEKKKDSIFDQRLIDAGIHFIELSGSTRRFPENVKAFRTLLVQKRYDVVHLNIFQGMSLFYAKLAKQAGVPVRIAHSHNTDLRKSATRPIKLAIHDTFRRRYTNAATQLWACSSEAARFMFSVNLLEDYGFQLIPNGIDVERFRFRPEIREQVRQELGLTDAFVVGNVGRLCYQKNQGFLLDVLAELLKIRPRSRLLLVGEGEDRPALQKRAEELGLSDKVFFYGTSHQVETLLWAMDVFAFPSRFEGLSVVAVEAQAAGLEMLCSNCMTEEVKLTQSFQWLPLEKGPVEWANALSHMSRNSGGQGRNENADAVQIMKFDIREVAKIIEGSYREGG